MTCPPLIVSECLIKPLHEVSKEAKQPLHFTAFELPLLNLNYSQKGLLYAKPENKDFSITSFLDDLKHSLSATLTHFYPLAARLATQIQHNPPSYVIYLDPKNSPGVKFIYAKTDATISDVITPVDVPLIIDSFFDLNNAINHDGHTLPLLSIKVTELTDGIFIGGSINHVIADGTSFWHFMTSWSETFNYKKISRPPVFKRQPLLQGLDDPPLTNLPYTHPEQFIERYKDTDSSKVFKERFFHFSSASVARLKEKANSECDSKKISSLQAVSALLWRCITRARRNTQPEQSETQCILAVCNRRRINPPLPDGYFGSPIHGVSGTTSVEELMTNGLGWAAMKLNEAVRNYDNAQVEKWVESWVRNPVVYKVSWMMNSPNTVNIGSSPRFDMYGCEFGLGKAIAVRSGSGIKRDGGITMYPGREGGGSIDVQVCLLPESMMDLERDEEFITARS